MRYLASLAVFTFFVGWAQAQGFVGFPAEKPDPNREAQAHAEPKAMFDRYLCERMAAEAHLDAGKAVVILIPELGCGFCMMHAIDFYKAHRAAYPAMRLVIAGHTDHAATFDLAPGSHLADPQNVCKQYGFGYGFPCIALLHDQKTVELLQIDAQTADQQLEKVLAFLKE